MWLGFFGAPAFACACAANSPRSTRWSEWSWMSCTRWRTTGCLRSRCTLTLPPFKPTSRAISGSVEPEARSTAVIHCRPFTCRDSSSSGMSERRSSSAVCASSRSRCAATRPSVICATARAVFSASRTGGFRWAERHGRHVGYSRGTSCPVASGVEAGRCLLPVRDRDRRLEVGCLTGCRMAQSSSACGTYRSGAAMKRRRHCCEQKAYSLPSSDSRAAT